jgi:aryl-alcohol dehydrogenase-like predicted oxidoreductase
MVVTLTKFGNPDLKVARLGLGLSEVGQDATQSVEIFENLLNIAFDNGINFLDTAACYGNSEELIGEATANRRDEFVISTKAGHVVGNYPAQEWTAQTVKDSIDLSLVRLKTHYLDIVHLHSCNVDVLEKGDVIEGLQTAKREGKTRYIGYSGDNEAAHWAVDSGLFDTLQTSFNLVDQQGLQSGLLAKAHEKGMGVIAKRAIANATWGADGPPSQYASEYYRRAHLMTQPGPIPSAPEHPILLALGFVLAHREVNIALVGTTDPQHMSENISWFYNSLPIEQEAVEELHQRFGSMGTDWLQQG